MDLSSLAQALLASEKAAAEDNPYTGFAQVANSLKWDPRQFSTGENIAGGLATGLLGGLFEGLSSDYQNDQSQKLVNVLGSRLQGQETELDDDLSPSVLAPMERGISLFNLGQGIEDKQLQRKADLEGVSTIRKAYADRGIFLTPNGEKIEMFNPLDDKKRETAYTALSKAIADNPKRAPQTIKAFKDAGLVTDDDVQSLALPDIATAEIAEPFLEETPSIFGPGKTASQKFREEYQRAMEDGAPGGAAIDAAKALTTVDRRGAEAATKRIEEIRSNARNMAQLADIQESAVQDAGSTGGAFGGVRDIASYVAAPFSKEERSQRAADVLLDSTKPDIIKASRAVGSGATSDIEFKTYLGAGASSNNTPQENKLLIEKTRNIAKVQEDYADFLDTFLAERGDLAGDKDVPSAEQLWDTYKKQNPLFVKDKKTGQLEYNTQRTPWREFDFKGAVTGNKSPQTKTLPGGTGKVPSPAEAQAELRRRGLIS